MGEADQSTEEAGLHPSPGRQAPGIDSDRPKGVPTVSGAPKTTAAETLCQISRRTSTSTGPSTSERSQALFNRLVALWRDVSCIMSFRKICVSGGPWSAELSQMTCLVAGGRGGKYCTVGTYSVRDKDIEARGLDGGQGGRRDLGWSRAKSLMALMMSALQGCS